MANTKGNQYPVWAILSDKSVVVYDTQQERYSMSKQEFAVDLAVSEDGTIWAMSTANAKAGGSTIYWNPGAVNGWNAIDTSIGAFGIAGGSGSSCYYLDENRAINLLDTDGTTKQIYSDKMVLDFDYGGGYFWAMLFDETKGQPELFYAEPGDTPDFKPFAGNQQPSNLSVNSAGNCYAIDNFNPMAYTNDGKTVQSPGTGANGIALNISSKNWPYVLSSKLVPSTYDNMILIWGEDKKGYEFSPTSMQGIKVYSTYYMKPQN